MPRVVSPLLSRLLLAAAAASFAGSALAAVSDPRPIATVSPGEIDRPVEVATACPTFTWGASTGATRIELVVLAGFDAEEPHVVLRRELPGVASAWTPGRVECLAPGAIYAWSVRRLDAGGAPIDGEAGWAVSRRFSIPTVPSQADVAAALEVLQRYQASGAVDAPSAAPLAAPLQAKSLSGRAVEVSGTSAIRGENPAATGANFGVTGQSASTAGAGLVGINTTAGPDLVLDGVAQGEADTLFTQSGIDRPSAAAQDFTIRNSLGGGMRLFVGSSQVSVSGHVHTGTDITAGVVADARLATTIARDSEILPSVLAGDGSGSTLDADTLDGEHRAYFSRAVHYHDGADITSGVVADTRIATTIARDTEILPAVLAGDGSGSTLDADLLDGLHGQNYQRRVTGMCEGGETLQGINTDGSVVCVALNGPPTVTTGDDPAAAVGEYTAIAIGVDDFPVISFYDQGAGNLKVLKCNDTACAGGDETVTVVDNSASDVGRNTAIAIGTDGFPIISYDDYSAHELRVAKCNDVACTGGNETITTILDPGAAVADASLAIGTDGFPVISYLEVSAGNLKVVKCNDVACAGHNETISTVDNSANIVGPFNAIAIGADGRPVIAYYDDTSQALKVAKCNDIACTGGNEMITTVDDTASGVGYFISLAIGADGFPAISYIDLAARALKFAKCNDAACAGNNESFALPDASTHTLDDPTSIEIGLDGFPVISFHDRTLGALKVAKCNDAACTTSLVSVIDAEGASSGDHSSIAIGADGFPVISYEGGLNLKVAKCHTRSCFAP